MTFQNGLRFPTILTETNTATGASNPIDATGEKIALIGYLKLASGPGTSKTLNTSGSSAITLRTGICTWANGASTMSIGIQDVDVTTGVPARPDGTFDVRCDITGGAGLTTAATNNFVPTSGSKTMAHGDLIAVVLDFSNRAGSDSITLVNIVGATNPSPFVVNDIGAGWAQFSHIPNVVITMSDGTLATLQGTAPIVSYTTETAWSNATNPDERGMLFQVPYACTIDGIWALLWSTDANADAQVDLYSTPLGTPASILGSPISYPAEAGPGAGLRWRFFPIPAGVSLAANTDYVMAIKATGTATLQQNAFTLMSATHRAFWDGGTTLAKATRDNLTGAFSTTTTVLYPMQISIKTIAAAGGGGQRVIGG